MSRMTSRPIEVRAAREQDDEFFYLGLKPFPGKEATRYALKNRLSYKPHGYHANKDGSATIEWHQTNLAGDGKTERSQSFYRYVSDLIVPRLADAVDLGVEFSNELELVRLQETDIKQTDNPEAFRVTRTHLGSMSLFTAEARIILIGERAA